MRVFLSHSISPEDGPVAARLKAVAAAYGVVVLLPEVTRPASAAVLSRTEKTAIKNADAVVVLATMGATRSRWVGLEVTEAIRLGKPIIALVEDGVEFPEQAGVQLVHFDRQAPAGHEGELFEALKNLGEQQKETRQNMAALGWIAGIAIGLVALGAIAVVLSTDNKG